MTHKQHLQQNILAAFIDQGITQAALAKQLSVTRQSIHYWLKTNNVSYDKLFELAELAGLEVNFSIRYKL
jgi:transcriptional regulator with XRE-family HTH domain